MASDASATSQLWSMRDWTTMQSTKSDPAITITLEICYIKTYTFNLRYLCSGLAYLDILRVLYMWHVQVENGSWCMK